MHIISVILLSQSLQLFILPFKWKFPYVPVLTEIDYIDAPGTFLMGCHLKHRNSVHCVSNLPIKETTCLSIFQKMETGNLGSKVKEALQLFSSLSEAKGTFRAFRAHFISSTNWHFRKFVESNCVDLWGTHLFTQMNHHKSTLFNIFPLHHSRWKGLLWLMWMEEKLLCVGR